MSLRAMMIRAWKLFSLPHDNPELMKAQYAAFSRQVPLLYLILIGSTWSLSFTHFQLAPHRLTLYIPAIVSIVGTARLVLWWRSLNRIPSDDRVRKMLRNANLLSVGLALGLAVWGITLYPYGDAYAKGHVAFYMGITVIGCIFCLMHLRSAALLVALIVNSVFVAFFTSTGKPAFIAIAFNVALVSLALMVILWVYYRNFTRLIDSRKELIAKQRLLLSKQAETQALSDANLQLANLDSLTRLPNRRSFFARLNERLAQPSGKNSRFALGIVDLDGFKPVNDQHGHVAGDALLVEVGLRLQDACGPSVFLSRLGGDEFGLIFEGGPGDQEIEALGVRICEAMRAPFAVGEVRVQISGSVGFAVFPDSATHADALFERANYALYRAKHGNRDASVLFSREHGEEIQHRAAIERALRADRLDSELAVVFQPIIDIRSGEPVGFETLARWESAELGSMPPGVFIPVAERIGVIDRLTQALLKKALAEAAKWPEDIRVSFNLSAKDIASPEVTMRIISLILKGGVDPRRIDLEITETAVLQDYSQARRAISTLKALGVGISLDDFGTGYSSLTHLHTLPLDKIKIDRSFVTGIQDNPASFKIVRSVLSLSRDMGLACIIEGVETEEELRILRKLGAVFVQGYYFSRPIPGSEVPGHLDAGMRRSPAARAASI